MDVFIFTRVISPLTTNSENKRSNDRNLSTSSTVPKNLDWKKRPRQRSQASKSVRKAPSRMGNSEARLHKREAGEKMEKLDNARKAILSRLEQLEVKEKPREMAQVR